MSLDPRDGGDWKAFLAAVIAVAFILLAAWLIGGSP